MCNIIDVIFRQRVPLSLAHFFAAPLLLILIFLLSQSHALV